MRRRTPELVLFSRRVEQRWQDVTAAEFSAQVDELARGLLAAGIAAGDRVALMSRTRYEWTLVDYAIWSVGAVTVPVYETSSAEQVAWILSDSGAVAAVVESAAHARVVGSVRGELPALADVWQIDAGGLDDLVVAGADVEPGAVAARRDATTPADLATLIYTSGTTGRPKGCELIHLNFMALCDNTVARLGEVVSAEGASTLLFLPLAHVFARFIQVLTITAGARLGHSGDIKTLLPDLAEFQPTFVLSVPRVFEKIYNSAEAGAEADGKGKIFARRGCDVHRLEQGPGHRRRRPRAAGQARGVRQARLHEAAQRDGRQGAVRRLRRRAARRAARPLLPRCRDHRPGGLRPDRDHRTEHREHSRPPGDRLGRRPAAGRLDPDRGRRRDPDQGRTRHARLLEQPAGHGRGPGRRLVLLR